MLAQPKKLSRSRRVFLSYSHDYKNTAREVTDILRQSGAKVWIDEEQIKPGDSISNTIQGAISDSDTFIALITNQPKENLLYELNIAKNNGLKVIPVLLRQIDLPPDLKDLSYIDLSIDKENGFRKLVEATA